MKREPNASPYEHFSVELETCITSDGALSTSVAGHVKNCRFWNRQSESATNRAAKPLVDQHAERLWIVCEFDHISVTIIGSEHVRLRSSSHGTYVVRSDQKRCGYVLWIHLWLQEHARKVDKMARSDVARVQIRSTRFARIRRHVLERRSANCYFWIGELGDSVRGGFADEESESERLSSL